MIGRINGDAEHPQTKISIRTQFCRRSKPQIVRQINKLQKMRSAGLGETRGFYRPGLTGDPMPTHISSAQHWPLNKNAERSQGRLCIIKSLAYGHAAGALETRTDVRGLQANASELLGANAGLMARPLTRCDPGPPETPGWERTPPAQRPTDSNVGPSRCLLGVH